MSDARGPRSEGRPSRGGAPVAARPWGGPAGSLDALAALVAVNITPLAGIFFLGWQPAGVLISYSVDTYVGFLSVILLMMIHVTGDEYDTPIEGWRRWSKLAGALVFFAAILILPLMLPILFVLGGDAVASMLLDDREFLLAIAAQVSMSVYASMRVHRLLQATHDDDRILTARGIVLAARWFVVFGTIGTGLVPALGPRLGSLVVIAIYAGASVYFELFPEHAMRLVRGNARPVVLGKDLESRARERGDIR
jgi:cytochrome c biogenesis protein CcdA